MAHDANDLLASKRSIRVSNKVGRETESEIAGEQERGNPYLQTYCFEIQFLFCKENQDSKQTGTGAGEQSEKVGSRDPVIGLLVVFFDDALFCSANHDELTGVHAAYKNPCVRAQNGIALR